MSGGQSHIYIYILQLESYSVNIDNNINWTQSCDYGGEGPKSEDNAHVEHFVYLAVKPLPSLDKSCFSQSLHHMAAASAHGLEDPSVSVI